MNPKLCSYCQKRPRRPGLATCSDECARKRNEAAYRSRAKSRKTDRRYVKVSKLTPEEREAHRKEVSRRNNFSKRQLYIIATPYCRFCGKTLLMCECRGDTRTPQYRDVVKVLNVRTMKRGVEIR